MQRIDTHAVKCRKYRYTVVGIVPLVQKVIHTGN